MAAFFYQSGANFYLRLRGSTTQVKFGAASSAGNFYSITIPSLATIYKNTVDSGSGANGTNFYTPSISVAPLPTAFGNSNQASRFPNSETIFTGTANTDYGPITYQDIRFNSLPNPYPVASFAPGTPAAALSSLNPGSTVNGVLVIYPGTGYAPAQINWVYNFNGGAWRQSVQFSTPSTYGVSIFDGGAWRSSQEVWIYDGGSWKLSYVTDLIFRVLTVNESGPGAAPSIDDSLDFAIQVVAVN